METNTLKKIVDALAEPARAWLETQYGTAAAFRNVCAYHHQDLGLGISWAAEQNAHALCATRDVPPETAPLAKYAGLRRGALQCSDKERWNAALAGFELRQHGVPDEHAARVERMITSAEVLRIEDDRIVQAADPDDPEQALFADADLASLGQLAGPYHALLLGLELQHKAGLIELPSPADGTLVEPDREAMLEFLRYELRLFSGHRFLLDASNRLYPHRRANQDVIGRLLERYEADRMTFAQMLVHTRRLACSDASGRELVLPARPARTSVVTATRAVVTLDMVSSTQITVQLPTLENYRFFAHQLGLFQDVVERTGGTLEREQGDGLVFTFEDPVRSLDFAAAGQMALHGRKRRDATAVAFRVGISSGRIAIGPMGIYGNTCVESARLCAAAQPSEVLIAASLRDELASQRGLSFGEPRALSLKGLGERIAYPLAWE